MERRGFLAAAFGTAAASVCGAKATEGESANQDPARMALQKAEASLPFSVPQELAAITKYLHDGIKIPDFFSPKAIEVPFATMPLSLYCRCRYNDKVKLSDPIPTVRQAMLQPGYNEPLDNLLSYLVRSHDNGLPRPRRSLGKSTNTRVHRVVTCQHVIDMSEFFDQEAAYVLCHMANALNEEAGIRCVPMSKPQIFAEHKGPILQWFAWTNFYG